ncbi:MAG TPA: tetratricopeptide repeat protein [Steroidobacteraceae bacterium]
MRNYILNARSTARAALITGALLVSAAMLLPPSPAAAAEEKKPTVSRDLAKTLKAAQEALQQKKYSDALAKLKEAEANPKKTPYDEHVINELAGVAYARTNNYPEAAKAFEAELNDGFLDQSEVPGRVKAVAQINYQIKNYDKAIEYGMRAVKGGYADDQMITLVGQSYYLKGDWKGTLKFEDSLIDSQMKKGQTPKLESLQLALSSCIKVQDSDCTTHELERMVEFYPKPEYWQQLLYTLYSGPQQSDRNMLQLFRLMAEVDVLKRPEDYTEMAQLALEQGSPGEAQHILEKAIQKNVFTDTRSLDKNKRLLESAKKAAASDQASLARNQSEADASQTGEKDVGVGLAYLGYQQYDKAVDELNKGITKGSLKNDAEAHLLLGIAQLKAGHKDDSIKAFHAVKGDPFLQRLATLWSLHAKQA